MKIRTLLVAIGIHVLLLFADIVLTIDFFRPQMEKALLPFQHTVRDFAASTQRTVTFLTTFDDVYNQNHQLLGEIARLRDEVSRNSHLQEENTILRQQLGAPISKEGNNTIAHVVAFDRSREGIRLILDAGQENSVEIGDTVTIGQSLVGKVIEVTAQRAVVLPIIATESVIPAYVQDSTGTRVNGVVRGEFNSGLVLTQFVRDEPLRSDEYVFTSGLDGEYPAGLLVGKVIQTTSTKSNAFQEALLQPLWELEYIDTVVIISLT